MDINRLSLEHSTMEIIVVVIEISLRFMLGGPSEKKIFLFRVPPSKSSFRHPETYSEIHGKKDVQGKNPRPALKWNMIMSHLAQLFFLLRKVPPRVPTWAACCHAHLGNLKN